MTNKKILIAVLALILLIAAVVVIIKQSKNPAPSSADKTDTTTPPPAQKERTYTTSATVKQVNSDNIQAEVPIITTGTDGFSVFNNQLKTFRIDANTEYFFVSKSGTKKPAKLTDVKLNSQISVTSLEDITTKSEVLAFSINIVQ